MATVYAVASAKGGVGKTTTTAAVATILADSGADVVAIDADLGMANLAGAVGVTPGEITLHDVLAGEAEPETAVREGPSGLRVVPGAADLDAYAAADPSGLRGVVEAFADADYVFIDAGAGLSHDSTLPLAIADETLLVSTPERSALGDTEKTRQLTERLGGTVAGAAITRVTADTDGVVTALLDAPILGRIPEDGAVARAATANDPLPAVAPDAPATRAYRDLARALTGAEVGGAGLDGPAADAAGGAGADDPGAEDAESDDAESDDGPTATDDDAVIVDEGPTPADDADDGDSGEAGERDADDGTNENAAAEADRSEHAAEDIIVADPDASGRASAAQTRPQGRKPFATPNAKVPAGPSASRARSVIRTRVRLAKRGSGSQPPSTAAKRTTSTPDTIAARPPVPGIRAPNPPAIAPSRAYVVSFPACHAADRPTVDPHATANPPHMPAQCGDPASPASEAAMSEAIKGSRPDPGRRRPGIERLGSQHRPGTSSRMSGSGVADV